MQALGAVAAGALGAQVLIVPPRARLPIRLDDLQPTHAASQIRTRGVQRVLPRPSAPAGKPIAAGAQSEGSKRESESRLKGKTA